MSKVYENHLEMQQLDNDQEHQEWLDWVMFLSDEDLEEMSELERMKEYVKLVS